jgi:hypothetical protein
MTPLSSPKDENGIGACCKSFIISKLALVLFFCSPYSPYYFLKRKKRDYEKRRRAKRESSIGIDRGNRGDRGNRFLFVFVVGYLVLSG